MRATQLKGRVVLIAGGTEGVGVQIVRAFLQRGAVVVVPSASAEQLEHLREDLHAFSSENVVTIFGDIGRLEEAERIRDVLLVRVGRLDAVVASLSRGYDCSSLVKVTFEMWQRALTDHLTTQFVIAHTFLPLLITQGHGSYTLVKRTAMECTAPHGPGAIVEAAQDMLVRVLTEELADTHVRINQVFVCPDTTVRKGADDPPEGLAGECVGTVTAWLASEEAAPVHAATIRLVADQSTIPNTIIP